MQDIDIKVIVDDENVLETTEMEEKPARRRLFGKLPFIGHLSYLIFCVTIIFLPLFILPASWGFQLEFAKKLFFSGGILLSFTLWLITRLEDGAFVFPGGPIFWSSLGVILSFGISSLISSSVGNSLVGLGYENDTLVAIVLFFIALFLSSTFFESSKKLSNFIRGFFCVSIIVGAVQLIQLFSPGTLLSGSVLSSVIGKWNDVGIYFGLVLILSLAAMEMLPLNNRSRKITWILSAISGFLVAIVNYDLIWGVISFFALCIFVYSLAYIGPWSKSALKKPSFVVLVLSVILFLSSNIIGPVLGRYNIYQLEVRPSWQSTVDISKKAMDKNIFFGSGPNTFSTEWAALKPDAVNTTAFWNTDFNVGFGRVPSYGVTLGIFGLLSFGILLLSLLYYGIRAGLAILDDPLEQYNLFIAAIATMFLWTFSVVYITDTVLLSLTFIFTGIFVAELARAGLIKNYRFSFFSDVRLSFAMVLMIVVLIITAVSGGYLLGKKFAAIYNFQSALYSYNISGNPAKAEGSIKKAIILDEQDLYYRSLSEIYITAVKKILNSPANIPKETILNQLQTGLSLAAGSAKKATEIAPSNYINWIILGNVGQTVMPLKNVVAGSYDLALNSYNKALQLNPNSPSIYLSLAQLEVSNGDVVKARDYINKALNKKGNYTNALFLLSQIESSQGNLPEAIKKVEQAAVFAPDDTGVLFQLGFLRYMDKNYSGSIDALGRAVTLQPNYSNAKYFLGLSHSKVGKITDAIKEFEEISVLNPDNREVISILKNLREGRGALENLTTSKSDLSPPEKRSKLPVKDISSDSVNSGN